LRLNKALKRSRNRCQARIGVAQAADLGTLSFGWTFHAFLHSLGPERASGQVAQSCHFSCSGWQVLPQHLGVASKLLTAFLAYPSIRQGAGRPVALSDLLNLFALRKSNLALS